MGFVFDDSVNIIDFCALVEGLADGYFDDDGKFVPHYGMLNAYRNFYALCVKESPYDDIDATTNDIFDIEKLLQDEEFIAGFNMTGENLDGLTFGHAMLLADSIVQNRLSSIGSIIDVIKKLGDSFKTVFTPESIEALDNLIADTNAAKEVDRHAE